MEVNAYLNFNGQCEEAFKFYEKVLGGKVDGMMKFEGTPAAEYAPAEWKDKVLHAQMKIGNSVLMGADAPPGQYAEAKGTTIAVHPKTVEEAEKVFAALAEGGTVLMPLEKTFWADKFGMLTDRFGTPWLINCSTADCS